MSQLTRPVSSNKIVPLTIIKGAGHEHIPIPEGECAIIADFHSVKSQSSHSTPYLTTGFYRVVPGPTRYGEYDYEETKYVLKGQIDITVSYHQLPVIHGSNSSYRMKLLVRHITLLPVTGPSSMLDPKPRLVFLSPMFDHQLTFFSSQPRLKVSHSTLSPDQ